MVSLSRNSEKVLKSWIVEEILRHVLRKILFFVVVCSGSKDSLEGFAHTFFEGFSRGFALDRRILSRDSKKWGAQQSTLFLKVSLEGLLWIEGFSWRFIMGCSKQAMFALGSQDGSRWSQDGPTWGQDGPWWSQTEPRWVKMEPRWPKMEPRWAKMGPSWSQDGAKMAQDGTKMG